MQPTSNISTLATSGLAWVIDEQKTLLFVNETFCKHFGVSEQQCIGKKITNIVPPAISRAVFDKHLEVFSSGKPVEDLQQIRWADGSNFVFHINIFPMNGDMGQRLLAGQAVNVPDISKLERELSEAKERLINLTRATSDAIWEWDMQSGQIFRNDTLMKMIGYQWDNSKGLSWWLRRIHPEDRDRVSDKVKEATDTYKKSWEDEYRFKCADGNYKHVMDKGFVVYENGLPVKMIGTLQDISHLRKLQDELADEKLQRQKEIAETVIRAQEKEKSRIGHELHDNVNQLLLTAKLFVDKFQAGECEEQQYLREKSLSYISMAIEEIRKLSKELAAPQLKDESLIGTIKSIVSDIELAGAMKIEFTYDEIVDQVSPGKKITLFRIVQEQLKNIIKHANASLTHIRIQQIESKIQLIICDNGNGFDPRQTYQGIGFSNIHERTEFYNGCVEVNSAPGKGCTLTINIPAAD